MKFLMGLLMVVATFMNMNAQESISDSSTKEAFPAEISFDANGKSYQLTATGVATRKKLIIKVYSIASYLQKDAYKPNGDNLLAILSDDNAKQLTIKWVRGVGSEQVRESYDEAFHKVLSDQEYAAQKANLDQFLQYFSQGANKGDEFIFRSVPGGYIEILINGKKVGSVTNKVLAKALWSIWFGDKSVVDRNDLLNRPKA